MRDKTDVDWDAYRSPRGEWLPDALCWRFLGLSVLLGALVGWACDAVLAAAAGFLAVLAVLVGVSWYAHRRRRALHRRAWARAQLRMAQARRPRGNGLQ